MVQIFLTYTASKFVINSALFSWQISAYFFQCTRLSTWASRGHKKWHSNVIRWFSVVFSLVFPWNSFRNSVLPCCPFMSFPSFSFLPFCPDFKTSFLRSFWLFASCLDFYDFTLILLLIPNPFCSSLSDLSPHGHPTVPVPITNVKLQPTDPPLQTTRSHWQWWKKSDLPKPINVPESNLAVVG